MDLGLVGRVCVRPPCLPVSGPTHHQPHRISSPSSLVSNTVSSGHGLSTAPAAALTPACKASSAWAFPLCSSESRGHVVARASKASPAVSATLQTGTIIEFTKDKDRVAWAVVQGADGKAKFWVSEHHAGQPTRKVSISLKQVRFSLPGGPHTEAQLKQYVELAAADSKSQSVTPASGSQTDQGDPLLAEAWEMAVADQVSTFTLSELADLVLDDESTGSLIRMHCMLQADSLQHFKHLVGTPALGDLPTYAPRAVEEIEASRVSQLEAKSVQASEQAWASAVQAALSSSVKRSQQPSREEWMASPHASRIAALQELAVRDVGPLSEATLALAVQSLILAGINPPSASPTVTSTNRGASPGASPLAEAAAGLLVDVRAMRRHEPLAALRRGVPLGDFSAALEQAAQELVLRPPPDSCAALRVDLTHLRCFAIDDQGTTEVDDALSCEPLSGQPSDVTGYKLWVHVSDPTRWLTPNSPLVEEARTRSRTIYFPWGSSAMFPRVLAEGPFSLRTGEVMDAMSTCFTLQADGSLKKSELMPSRVRITHQFTYDAADALLSEVGAAAHELSVQTGAPQHDPQVATELAVLSEAGMLRRSYRLACGAIEIPMPEAKVTVRPNQLDLVRPAVSIKRISQWESASRAMVSEMMILSGEAAGTLGSDAGIALPYRGQPPPRQLPAKQLAALPPGPCMGHALRRCMTRSTVAPRPQRHSSLALDAYVQVTSPIRRWADIVAHFNLKALLLGTSPPPFSGADIEALHAASSSDRMRQLGGAEGAETAYWAAEFFRQRMDSGQGYSATFLGWVKEEIKLGAVLLDEFGLETVCKVDVEGGATPGDELQLALVEARPVAGLLRFQVTGHVSREEAEEAQDSAAMDSIEAAWAVMEAREPEPVV